MYLYAKQKDWKELFAGPALKTDASQSRLFIPRRFYSLHVFPLTWLGDDTLKYKHSADRTRWEYMNRGPLQAHADRISIFLGRVRGVLGQEVIHLHGNK